MTGNVYMYLIVAAFTIYAVRALPMTLIRKDIKSPFIRSFLYYVPYVTLSVMTFPAILEATGNTASLTEAEREKIQSIRESLGTNFCRRCNYCAPCAAGINIPIIFLIEGYYTRYNLKEWALKRYAGQEKTASDCIGCGACEDRCPYNLPIREMMKNTAKVFGK